MGDFDSHDLEEVMRVRPSTLRYYAQQTLGMPKSGRGRRATFSFGDAITLIVVRDLVQASASAEASGSVAKILRGELPRLMLDPSAEFFVFYRPSLDPDAPAGSLDLTTTRDFDEAAGLLRDVPNASFINARLAFLDAGRRLLEFQKRKSGRDG